MTKGTIIFNDVKPHGGDQRRAFEEMCFQLFAKQFAEEGEPIRREGSGGDAGLEGYIADSAGCAIIGLQSKFFPEKFGPSQWRQIDESVQTALKGNSADCSLKVLVVATPREFNKQEKAKWERSRANWQRSAKQIGYRSAPKFVHWGSSFLESALKENKNRGQLLYWFNYEMGGRIHYFQGRRLEEEPSRKWGDSWFDDRIARRYVLQRTVELGIAKQDFRDVNPPRYDGRNRPSIERLGKKYQWIAMHEFLGYLSDHYHMAPEWQDESRRFESARQFSLPDLLDPFIWKPDEPATREDWEFIQKPTPWWVRYPNPFPRVLTKARREKLVAMPNIPEPTLLLCRSHENCEWAALSGYYRWEEPVPCYVPDKWSTPHGLHSWLFNSYAVPEAVLDRFVTKMIEPVLDHDMRPPEPEFRSEVLSLLNYPDNASELERNCGCTFARTPGAWFTTCNYSDEQDGDRSLHGYVPSPPLAKLLKVQWTKSGLDFCGADLSRCVVFDVREEDHQACLCQVKPLLTAFSKRKLRLVWRVYGWKWIGGTHDHHSLQREYWALYSLDALAKPICLGGGTWIVEPNPTREPLPWPVSTNQPSKRQSSATL